MEAMYAGPNGQAWRNTRIQIYGWEDFSWNGSTSTNTSRGPNANFPLIYDLRPNRFEQNQFVLYIERVPDEFQSDHIDWGFRVSGVYGLDYRFMISRGLFSDQLLKHNRYYGFDMPMVYIDLYIPRILQGMNVRVGRIISEPDIEAQLAPNNLMASHSLVMDSITTRRRGSSRRRRSTTNGRFRSGFPTERMSRSGKKIPAISRPVLS